MQNYTSRLKIFYTNEYAFLVIDNTHEFRSDQKNNWQVEDEIFANDKKPAEINNKIVEKPKNSFTNNKTLQKSIVSIQWLMFAEFAYNNSVYSITDVFLFKAMYEWNFKFVEKVQILHIELQISTAQERVKNVIIIKKI